MGSLDLTEITRILQLDEAQTEVEINTCNTIDADLKNQTRTKLTESNEIKQRQALAVQNGEDVRGINQELKENDKDLKDLKEEMDINTTKKALLVAQVTKRPRATAETDQTIKDSGLEIKDSYSKQDLMKVLTSGKSRDSKDQMADMMSDNYDHSHSFKNVHQKF